MIYVHPFLLLSFFCSCSNAQFLHEFHVTENTMTYKSILNLRTLLMRENKIDQTKSSEYNIYISNAIDKGLFRLDAEANLRVAKLIDREELCPQHTLKQSVKLCGSVDACCHIMEFQVSYKNNNKETNSYFLRVFIDDENDNVPVFPDVPVPYCVIYENKPIGSHIPLPRAMDPDNRTFGITSYRLLKPFVVGNSSNFRLLTDSDGSEPPRLTVSGTIDREKMPLYRFQLLAVDGSSGGGQQQRNTGSVEITVEVRDDNDNKPQFDKHVYTCTVREHSVPDTVLEIIVTDKDENENADIDLRLLFGSNHENYSHLFSLEMLDRQVGLAKARLRAIAELDYDNLRQSLFEFGIEATDNGRISLSNKALVRIQLENVNDERPQITVIRQGRVIKSGFEIDEGTPGHTLLSHIHVQDLDSSTSQLQCTLTAHNSIFSVKESQLKHPTNLYKKYTLRTVSTIDREKIQTSDNSYTNSHGTKLDLAVRCCDMESPPRSLCTRVQFYIVVNDVNDNAPEFSQSKYFGYINENAANNRVRFDPPIAATDRDISINARLSFSLEDFLNSSDARNFKINRDSGRISNIVPFDFEQKHNYSFDVVVQDSGYSKKLRSVALVVVSIRDVNDNPPIFEQSHYSFEVAENTPVGSLVGHISAQDADTLPDNKAVRYVVRDNVQNKGAHLINVDHLSGQIRTSQLIDREKIGTITVVVEARNPQQLVLQRTLQEVMIVIKVLNENDCAPTFRLVEAGNSNLIISYELLQLNGQVCDAIPYSVEDKDDETGNPSGGACCSIRLKNDYDGLISLSKESQSILCVNKVPEKRRDIHVTLIASDNHGNKSLEAEISFSLSLRYDPGFVVRRKMQQQQKRKAGSGAAEEGRRELGRGTGRDSDRGGHSQEELDRNEGSGFGSDIRQIILIAALASLAGLFVISIILILLFSQRRCTFLSAAASGVYDSTGNEDDIKTCSNNLGVETKSSLSGPNQHHHNPHTLSALTSSSRCESDLLFDGRFTHKSHEPEKSIFGTDRSCSTNNLYNALLKPAHQQHHLHTQQNSGHDLGYQTCTLDSNGAGQYLLLHHQSDQPEWGAPATYQPLSKQASLLSPQESPRPGFSRNVNMTLNPITSMGQPTSQQPTVARVNQTSFV